MQLASRVSPQHVAIRALVRRAPTCLPDTRVDVLREIFDWADRQDNRCIFWLNGLAGTRKSTIARTIARKYSEEHLGASFFFSRGGGLVMDPELRYKEHIANTPTKGLNAAMALKRLQMTSPSTARQLFGAAVAPSGRLRLERMESCMRELSYAGAKQGTANRSTSNHRDVSYSGHRNRRSRGEHTNSPKAPSRHDSGVTKNRRGVPGNSDGSDGMHSTIHNSAVGGASGSANRKTRIANIKGDTDRNKPVGKEWGDRTRRGRSRHHRRGTRQTHT